MAISGLEAGSNCGTLRWLGITHVDLSEAGNHHGLRLVASIVLSYPFLSSEALVHQVVQEHSIFSREDPLLYCLEHSSCFSVLQNLPLA